tara:strand:+ start:130 stop:405 length:276 start_codon:yes stop_codon:yes gene_type:complete
MPFKLIIFINIIHLGYLSNCINYSNYPNLLFIVKSRKKIDDNEIIKPNIIKVFDFSFPFLTGINLEEDAFLSLLRRFEKSLLTLKIYLIKN